MTRVPRLLAAAALAALAAGCVPLGDAEAAPPSAGPIRLVVDATEAPRKILHARLTIPARPGPTTLLYPRWIPGEHGPTGPIVNLAGLRMSANGQPVAWRRDGFDVFAFHCDVPAGASSLDVQLDFLSPVSTDGFSGAASATAQLVDLAWNQVLLYPAGAKSASEWTYVARLELPAGWKYGTALPVASEAAGAVEFKPAPLTTLVDSPVIAGAHFRAVPLSRGEPAHELDLVSDSAAALEIKSETVGSYERLVTEANALFGAHHYRSYRFLYTLSDHVASFGLEHHESSDDRTAEHALVDDDLRKLAAALLPHEFVHSWNGKYRRPASLATADYQQPMVGDLLWVYEGLTDYLGHVLTARSGLWTEADYRENLALMARGLDRTPGRSWRSLGDTATAAQVLYGAPSEWASWRRGVDFYAEGDLVWLEVDSLIRQKTGGKRSLDDFCRRFHGGESGPPAVKPYTFDDVVKALNEVAPNDWAALLHARIDAATPKAPLGGIAASGWRLAYDDVPNEIGRVYEGVAKVVDLQASIGLVVREDATVVDVVPGSAADKAGLGPGMKLVAVDGRRYASRLLREAVKASATSKDPIELLAENGEFFAPHRLDYHGGERFPHLVRDPSAPDLLTAMLKPIATSAPAPAPAAK